MPFRLAPARRAAACLTVAVLAGVAACQELAFEPQNPATVAYAPSLGINLSQFTRLPSGVYVRDLAVGSGTTVDSTSTVGISYRGLLANGVPFDTTFAARTYGPVPLTIFVRGFQAGLIGARQGSRRQLIIPPDQGYGSRTRPDNSIPAGSVLFFDVNLVSVVTPPPATPTTPTP